MAKWIYERFRRDAAIYAICPVCSFRIIVGRFGQIDTYYNFCPMCGEDLRDDASEVEVIWKERDITALYEEESYHE